MQRSIRLRREPPDRESDLAQVELLAWLLDNSIPIPGTRRRIGIDAIIGLVPGVGDLLSGGLGLFVVMRAAGLGVPRVVVARMLLNAGLDFVIGSIPVLGDAFDLWFKANARNLALARRYVATPEESTRATRIFIGGVVIAVVLVAIAMIWFVWSLLAALAGALG